MDREREEVLAMEPGPELDARVAERVMGWQWLQSPTGTCAALFPPDHPNPHWTPANPATPRCLDWHEATKGFGRGGQFSADIAAAWEVDKANWWWIFIEHDDILVVRIFEREASPMRDPNQPIAWVNEPWHEAGKVVTYTTARCKAALLAVQGEEVRG